MATLIQAYNHDLDKISFSGYDAMSAFSQGTDIASYPEEEILSKS